MATKLIALTSSDLGKVLTSVRRPTGTIMAPPAPCRTRHATIRCRSFVRPHSIDPTVNMPIAEANTRRVPNRSAIQPLTGMKTARLSV
jgi:hypothetical protein